MNVQFDESDDDADNEDVYGEERINDDESEGQSSDEETEAQRHAIQAAAVRHSSVQEAHSRCGAI